MFKISKEDAVAIRNNLRGVNVVIVNRQSNAKKKGYYVESTSYVQNYLEKIHKNDKIEHYE